MQLPPWLASESGQGDLLGGWVQVGQLLTTLRFASANRLLPLTSQILGLLRRRGPAAGADGGAEESGSRDRVSTPANPPTWFAGLNLGVTAVGLDAVLLVEGRELVAFQLVDASLSARLAPMGGIGPGAPAAESVVTLQVDALSLLDLQARPVKRTA